MTVLEGLAGTCLDNIKWNWYFFIVVVEYLGTLFCFSYMNISSRKSLYTCGMEHVNGMTGKFKTSDL